MQPPFRLSLALRLAALFLGLILIVLVLILVSVGGWLLYRWIVGAPGALARTASTTAGSSS